MSARFDVLFLEGARAFLLQLKPKAKEKIIYNIDKARILNDATLFKKLNSDIWEFRTEYEGIQYRLLAFWDRTGKKPALVICTHGFVKKTDKTPPQEIQRAEYLLKMYNENRKRQS